MAKPDSSPGEKLEERCKGMVEPVEGERSLGKSDEINRVMPLGETPKGTPPSCTSVAGAACVPTHVCLSMLISSGCPFSPI